MPIKNKLIPLVLLFTTTLSCNFYQIQENRLKKTFKKHGLSQHVYTADKTRISYWEGGEGRPLVMLHGFGASAIFQWEKQIAAFIKDRRLIIPDLVYFGESSSSRSNYSVDFQASTIIRLLDSLQVDSFDLIGLSYGGLTAATIADKIPGRVTSLIISDSPIKFYTHENNLRAVKKFKARDIKSLLIPEKPKDVPRLLKLAYHKPPGIPGFALKNIHEKMFYNQPREKGQLLDYMLHNEKHLRDKEYRIKNKILLIWGRYDFLIPPRIGESLHSYFKRNSRLVIIEKAAHMPNMERPKKFNEIVLNFLKTKN